jgi:hypothetical protein
MPAQTNLLANVLSDEKPLKARSTPIPRGSEKPPSLFKEKCRSGLTIRDLGRRLASNDPGLTIVHPNAGGIDVGNESHSVVSALRKQLPSYAAAIKAMARYLAVLIYRLLTRGEAWVDRGADTFERRRTELADLPPGSAPAEIVPGNYPLSPESRRRIVRGLNLEFRLHSPATTNGPSFSDFRPSCAVSRSLHHMLPSMQPLRRTV